MAGRPITFDRRQAVKQAMEEFWLHGHGGVSVNGLCATLGITRSSFYNTFGSLDALFDECLTLYGRYSPAHRIMRDRAVAGENTAASIYIRRFFRHLCAIRGNDPINRGCLMVNTLAEMENLSPDLQSRVRGHGLDLPTFFTHLVKQGQAAGDLPTGVDTETLVGALHMLAIGINTMSRTLRDEDGLWSVADLTLTGLGIVETDQTTGPG